MTTWELLAGLVYVAGPFLLAGFGLLVAWRALGLGDWPFDDGDGTKGAVT